MRFRGLLAQVVLISTIYHIKFSYKNCRDSAPLNIVTPRRPDIILLRLTAIKRYYFHGQLYTLSDQSSLIAN